VALLKFFTGRTDFETDEGIRQFITRSRNFDPNTEDPSEAELLLIFQTSNQQTWLVATRERLYCILDDIRKDQPHINWSMPKGQLVTDNKVTVEIVTKERRKRSGLVDISSKHENWLYTKHLFSESGIEDQIRNLIAKKMIDE